MNNELENLTVVVLTHKTNKNTLENCLSLIDPNVKIILVENSNNFLHKEHIENKYKNVSIFCSGSNLGYGGGNNIGLKLTKTPYALILNPDVNCKENFFKNIKEYLNDKIDYAIIGCQYENEENWQPAGFFSNKKNLRDIQEETNQKLTKVDWVVGCAMLLNLKKFKSKAIFDENFFFFFEEFDLCKMLKSKNENVYSSKNLIINHLRLKSSYAEKIYEYDIIKFKNWHYMWSFFYYHKKNEGFLKALYASKGRLLRSLFRIFYFSIFNNRKEKLKYSYRFLGLINSIFAKKSWFRINDREN